jgi:CheY-like chemotaxis protein
MRIAAIDDDPNFLYLIELMLKKSGVKAEIALFSDAQSALKAIEFQIPDLIFLDLFMPGMNGWDFIQELESKSIQSEVYFLSSSVDSNDRAKALKFQSVKDFLSKPLTFKRLNQIFSLN